MYQLATKSNLPKDLEKVLIEKMIEFHLSKKLIYEVWQIANKPKNINNNIPPTGSINLKKYKKPNWNLNS